jgi:hypothetical protein
MRPKLTQSLHCCNGWRSITQVWTQILLHGRQQCRALYRYMSINHINLLELHSLSIDTYSKGYYGLKGSSNYNYNLKWGRQNTVRQKKFLMNNSNYERKLTILVVKYFKMGIEWKIEYLSQGTNNIERYEVCKGGSRIWGTTREGTCWSVIESWEWIALSKINRPFTYISAKLNKRRPKTGDFPKLGHKRNCSGLHAAPGSESVMWTSPFLVS